MKMSHIVSILQFLVLVCGTAKAQQQPPNSEMYLEQAADFYNKGKFNDALDLLKKNSAAKNKDSRWYYFYGISLAQTGHEDEAIENLNTFIGKTEISKTSMANYHLGRLYFNKQDYEKAINAFQVSLDTSSKPELDRVLDIQIEKTLRYIDYYSKHKRTNMLFILGYGYDTNAVDLSQELSEEKLNAHSLNYGLTYSFRSIDRMDLVLEPSVSVVDKYSIDSKFKPSSTVQANDNLQALLAVPVVFKNKAESTMYNFSLNYYVSYLPIHTNTRELYMKSLFGKARFYIDLTDTRLLDAAVTVASDETKAYVGTDSDATGTRTEGAVTVRDFLNRERTRYVSYGLSLVDKKAKGSDMAYQDASAVFDYAFHAYGDLNSVLTSSLDYVVYPNRAVKRNDTKFKINYSIFQPIAKSSGLTYVIGATLNNSNQEIYKYNDVGVAVIYTYSLGF